MDDTTARPGPHDHLWTPWRMRYVGGGAKESGCVFCNRLAAPDDDASLILHRGRHVFVILNLFPYNSGHLMIVPNAHLASPEDLPPDAAVEMALLLAPTLRALRRVLGCAGFNTGLNIGEVAGAGIAAHLHQHVVPRWVGDANFMPLLAGAMVMPELIPVTYAKIRAELARELAPAPITPRALVALGDTDLVLVSDMLNGPELPILRPDPDEAVWRAFATLLPGVPVELTGWAGGGHADPGAPITLAAALPADQTFPAGLRPLTRAEAAATLPADQAAALQAR